MRAEPNGFLVHLLNHSDTTAWSEWSYVSALLQIHGTKISKNYHKMQRVQKCNGRATGCALFPLQCVRFLTFFGEKKKISRCGQGSNLCGQSPMDFKSISLTTRTPQHGDLTAKVSLHAAATAGVVGRQKNIFSQPRSAH